MERMYVLVEEFFDGMGTKEVNIIGTSLEKNKLKREIRKIREKDSRGFFKENGIYNHDEWCLESYSHTKSLGYYITPVPYLN